MGRNRSRWFIKVVEDTKEKKELAGNQIEKLWEVERNLRLVLHRLIQNANSEGK